jgi:lysine 2,3-aminomutase
MEGLRGHMSGLAIPTYVVDAPHGGGKIPLLPNYLVSASDDCVVLRNYEGMLVRYQAEDNPTTIVPTANRGVSQLIQGTQTALVPPNSERMARRRQYMQNKRAAKKAAECCDSGNHEEPAPREERLASLPVVS